MFKMLISICLFFVSNVGFSDISILAIGDSLTAGHHSKGEAYSPYTDTMNHIFSGTDVEVVIDNKGVDTLPIEMIRNNLEKAYKQKKYDLTIFLGGTNDLGYGFDEKNIIKDLQVTYAKIIKSGSFLIGVTIPQLKTYHPQIILKREYINKWIRKYFRDDIKPHQGLLFDLEDLVENDWADEFWDDSIHFSPDGYQKFGEKMAASIEDEQVFINLGSNNKNSSFFSSKFKNILNMFNN